jgi:hypothetical protein
VSKTAKARFSARGKVWKDTVYASRSQARARAIRKRLRAQIERARSRAEILKAVVEAALVEDETVTS